MQEEVVRSVVAAVSPAPADVVYDLGSGDGRFLVAFAAALQVPEPHDEDRHGGPRQVVGFELDASLASVARTHADAACLSHLIEVREEGKRPFPLVYHR